jgi:hypothetical membrane protein
MILRIIRNRRPWAQRALRARYSTSRGVADNVRVTVEIVPTRPARTWATVAFVGILIYVVIDVVLAFLRPDYSVLRNAESDYGRGRFAWLMDINFVLRGVFSLVAAVALLRSGMARRWTAVLLIIWALTSALLAFFPDNPPGYPVLASGSRHDLLALIAFIAITVATIGMSFSKSTAVGGLRTAQRVLSIVGPAAFILLVHPFGAFGLIERIFLAAEIGWLAVTMIGIVRLESSKA